MCAKHMYTRTCEICGKEFQSPSAKKRICYEDHYRICPYCGTQVLWNSYLEFRGCKPCIYRNSSEKRKATMMEKYGAGSTLESPELLEKVKKTNLEKHGAENPGQSKEIREKIKAYWQYNYGVDNPMQVPEIAKKSAEHRSEHIGEILEKTRQTWLKKYGVDNVFKSEEIKAKIALANLEKYGVEHPMHCPEIRKKFEETCKERHGAPYYVLTDEWRKSQYCRVSSINKYFAKLLEDQNVPYNMEYRVDRKAYDFIVESSKILIEINPSYTHSIVPSHWTHEGLPKYYHVDKTQLANDHGFECVHVWDWDDYKKVIQTLFPRNHLDASEFQVYKLNVATCNEFLEENDIQLVPRNQMLCLGLVKDQAIYQVLTFGEAKHQEKFVYQVYRACTKLDYEITGGFDLLSKSASELGVYSCIAYADVAKPWMKQIYESIGMKFQRRNPPMLRWSKEDQVQYDYIIQMHESEKEDEMIQEGWLPVFDCGTDVYTFE